MEACVPEIIQYDEKVEKIESIKIPMTYITLSIQRRLLWV